MRAIIECVSDGPVAIQGHGDGGSEPSSNPSADDRVSTPSQHTRTESQDDHSFDSTEDSSLRASSQLTQSSAGDYYAPVAELPHPLPTRDAILGSCELLSERFGHKMVGVGALFVVKHGPRVDLYEGRIMLYLSGNRLISVPRVYALYHDPNTNQNFIIMERVQGSTLEQLRPSLNDAYKEHILTTLKANLDAMRGLPSPGGFCGLDKRPLPCDLFWTGQGISHYGPFDTEEEFNAALIKTYTSTSLTLPTGKASFYERAFHAVLRGHSPVFTHGDLQRKNNMVKTAKPLELRDDEAVELVIIDWETAGWYPTYWEYVWATSSPGVLKDD